MITPPHRHDSIVDDSKISSQSMRAWIDEVTKQLNDTAIVIDSTAGFAAKDPILNLGQPGYDNVGNVLKIGDGVNPWTSLTAV